MAVPLVIIVQFQCCYCYFVFAHANAISREIRHCTVTDNNLLKPHGVFFSSSIIPHRPHTTHCLPLDRVKVKHRLAPLHRHVMSHNRNRQPRKERLERRRLYLLSKQLINNGFKRITDHGAPDDESSATTNLRNAESAGYYTTVLQLINNYFWQEESGQLELFALPCTSVFAGLNEETAFLLFGQSMEVTSTGFIMKRLP